MTVAAGSQRDSFGSAMTVWCDNRTRPVKPLGAIPAHDSLGAVVRNTRMAVAPDPYVEWIRWSLVNIPGKTHAGLAASWGVDRSAVTKTLSGKRKVKASEISLAAAYFDQPAPVPLLPISGKVGAAPDGRVLQAEGQGTGDFAPMLPGMSPDAIILEVDGISMRGVADNGGLIYYQDSKDPPTDDMLGQFVVVGLPSGEVLIKRLLRGSAPGLFDLESQVGEPRKDERVLWAAHIAAIIPPWMARRIIRRGHL